MDLSIISLNNGKIQINRRKRGFQHVSKNAGLFFPKKEAKRK